MQETLGIHRFNTLGFEYLQWTMKVCDVLIGSFAEVQIRITCTLKLVLWVIEELVSKPRLSHSAVLSNQTFFFSTPDLGSNSWVIKNLVSVKKRNSHLMKDKVSKSFKNICLVSEDDMLWEYICLQKKKNPKLIF